MTWSILESVQTCVTSPPYWGLRDYGTATWEGGDEQCDHLAPPGGGTRSSGLANYDNGLTADAITAKVDQHRRQLVAARLDRDFIGIELNVEYAELARNRIREDAPLLNVQAEAA